MEEYLNKTIPNLKSNNFANITIVYGNESCDLDSAVSSLVYSSFLYWQYEIIKSRVCTKAHRDENFKDNIFLPILNVKREDFSLKTEVLFCFSQHGINVEELIFRNDIDLEALVSSNGASVILVDHHVLSPKDEFLVPHVTEIIDHRPMDRKQWKFKDNVRSTIEVVGSCSTLICSRIKDFSNCNGGATDYFKKFPICAELLHSTIILDTVNFSKEVNKATPLDNEIVLFLETIIKPKNSASYRKEKLNELVAARRDISRLDAGQLLKKDVKIVGKIIAPSFPIPVKEFLQRPNVEEAMSENLQNNQCALLVLLGMKINSDSVLRDLAVFSLRGYEEHAAQLAEALEQWRDPNLQLKTQISPIKACKYYEQENMAASRKQVIPILNDFINKHNLS